MSDEICVVAELLAKKGKGDALAEALQQCALPSRKEAGCLSYVAHRDTAHAERVVMIERWRSRSDLAEHEKTAHFSGLVAVITPWLEKPMQLSILKALP